MILLFILTVYILLLSLLPPQAVSWRTTRQSGQISVLPEKGLDMEDPIGEKSKEVQKS